MNDSAGEAPEHALSKHYAADLDRRLVDQRRRHTTVGKTRTSTAASSVSTRACQARRKRWAAR